MFLQRVKKKKKDIFYETAIVSSFYNLQIFLYFIQTIISMQNIFGELLEREKKVLKEHNIWK